MYVFHVHRELPRWRLVLADGEPFPPGTSPLQWERTRVRQDSDTNADVRHEVDARGYCLFAITATLEDLERERRAEPRSANHALEVLIVGGREYAVSRAAVSDVPALVALLADDVLGAQRESSNLAPYAEAFQQIDADPNQLLAAVRDDADRIVGTMQLTLIPGLSRGGATRVLIEAVRVAASTRDSGLGAAMIEWAHEYGRQRGARFAQLTSDRRRPDAHRFYQRLGYVDSHVGFKLEL